MTKQVMNSGILFYFEDFEIWDNVYVLTLPHLFHKEWWYRVIDKYKHLLEIEEWRFIKWHTNVPIEYPKIKDGELHNINEKTWEKFYYFWQFNTFRYVFLLEDEYGNQIELYAPTLNEDRWVNTFFPVSNIQWALDIIKRAEIFNESGASLPLLANYETTFIQHVKNICNIK